VERVALSASGIGSNKLVSLPCLRPSFECLSNLSHNGTQCHSTQLQQYSFIQQFFHFGIFRIENLTKGRVREWENSNSKDIGS
jgi:hypothetical protein